MYTNDLKSGSNTKDLKDVPIIEISSKQGQVQTQNVQPPIKPKEIKRNN